MQETTLRSVKVSDPVVPPELVPARMLNEFTYCPRLAYLEWVQGEFVDSADTVEGRFQHRRVHRSAGDLPAATENEDNRERQPETVHARSIMLSDETLGLIARIDLVEGRGDAVTPVDYKHGRKPDVPEGAWEPERVQLCCQGLLLRASGYTCTHGVLYFAESRDRVVVPLDDALVSRTRQLLEELRTVASSGRIPPPLVDSPKCPGCSLAGICLPDETNLLMAGGIATDADEEQVRRLVPARDDAMPLYVQEQGARITKRGEVLEVWLRDRKLGEARLFETCHVCLFGNVQVTTQALHQLLDGGIPVAFFSTGGWFRGVAHGMWHKNVERRRAQYTVGVARARSVALARSFVSAKIEDCRTLLMRNHPGLPPGMARSLARLAADARRARTMDRLLGIEGMAARLYFSASGGMLKSRQGPEVWAFGFNGRNRRPPVDPVNALLSYAYAILAKDLTVTTLLVGFDPFQGFYHQPRYGRPALALDLMEEFRPIVADSVVLSVVNNGVLSPNDFVRRGPAVALKSDARRKFIKAYERRLDTLVTHPGFGYRISYRRVLEVQARLLGRVLSGELGSYPAFRTR